MKLHSGLLLLCLTLTVSSRAEEVMPVKTEAAGVKRELVWPEIKDPQALIEFAKAEIFKVKNKTNKWDQIHLPASSPVSYLNPLWGEAYVDDQVFFINLDTHPQTGQGLIIIPTARENEGASISFLETEHDLRLRPRISNTEVPEIKRVLVRFSKGAGPITRLANYQVRWESPKNLSDAQSTDPQPISMELPDYPPIMLRYGLDGDAKIEFEVSAQGSVGDVKIIASKPEFEAAVRKAVGKWLFEPGVDLETRLPVKTKISLTVRFKIED